MKWAWARFFFVGFFSLSHTCHVDQFANGVYGDSRVPLSRSETGGGGGMRDPGKEVEKMYQARKGS